MSIIMSMGCVYYGQESSFILSESKNVGMQLLDSTTLPSLISIFPENFLWSSGREFHIWRGFLDMNLILIIAKSRLRADLKPDSLPYLGIWVVRVLSETPWVCQPLTQHPWLMNAFMKLKQHDFFLIMYYLYDLYSLDKKASVLFSAIRLKLQEISPSFITWKVTRTEGSTSQSPSRWNGFIQTVSVTVSSDLRLRLAPSFVVVLANFIGKMRFI